MTEFIYFFKSTFLCSTAGLAMNEYHMKALSDLVHKNLYVFSFNDRLPSY